MTVPPWEEGPTEFIPPPPDVSALAQTLARLTQACWASEKPESTTLSRGLTLTAFLVDDDLQLALTRTDSEPSEEEAEIVAREAGWPHFESGWRVGNSGRRGLVLTRSSAPRLSPPPKALPTDPCEAVRTLLIARRDRNRRVQADLTQKDWDRARGSPFPQAQVIALLTRHTDPSYTPSLTEGARAARTGYLKTLSVPELLEELDGYWSHWPARRSEVLDQLDEPLRLPTHHPQPFATAITVP